MGTLVPRSADLQIWFPLAHLVLFHPGYDPFRYGFWIALFQTRGCYYTQGTHSCMHTPRVHIHTWGFCHTTANGSRVSMREWKQWQAEGKTGFQRNSNFTVTPTAFLPLIRLLPGSYRNKLWNCESRKNLLLMHFWTRCSIDQWQGSCT